MRIGIVVLLALCACADHDARKPWPAGAIDPAVVGVSAGDLPRAATGTALPSERFIAIGLDDRGRIGSSPSITLFRDGGMSELVAREFQKSSAGPPPSSLRRLGARLEMRRELLDRRATRSGDDSWFREVALPSLGGQPGTARMCAVYIALLVHRDASWQHVQWIRTIVAQQNYASMGLALQTENETPEGSLDLSKLSFVAIEHPPYEKWDRLFAVQVLEDSNAHCVRLHVQGRLIAFESEEVLHAFLEEEADDRPIGVRIAPGLRAGDVVVALDWLRGSGRPCYVTDVEIPRRAVLDMPSLPDR
ncbi:MAG: hypothetical protein AAGD14_00525 [Planctomycetota bacterium]